MKNIIALLLLFFTFSINIFSQSPYKNIIINDVVSPESEYTPSEPTIMINPYNQNHIVAASNVDGYYYSFDGGLTWSVNTLTSSAFGVWGDPSIVMDGDQNFYYFHLAKAPKDGNWYDRMICQKSFDGGKTWDTPGGGPASAPGIVAHSIRPFTNPRQPYRRSVQLPDQSNGIDAFNNRTSDFASPEGL